MAKGSVHLLLLLFILLNTGCGDSGPVQEGSNGTGTATEDPVSDRIHEVRDKDGTLIMRGRKVNGQRHGSWESYFPDGSLKSRTNFEHGVKQGVTSVYQEHGVPYYSGFYKDDLTVGEWMFYDSLGEPAKLVRYDQKGEKLEERDL